MEEQILHVWERPDCSIRSPPHSWKNHESQPTTCVYGARCTSKSREISAGKDEFFLQNNFSANSSGWLKERAGKSLSHPPLLTPSLSLCLAVCPSHLKGGGGEGVISNNKEMWCVFGGWRRWTHPLSAVSKNNSKSGWDGERKELTLPKCEETTFGSHLKYKRYTIFPIRLHQSSPPPSHHSHRSMLTTLPTTTIPIFLIKRLECLMNCKQSIVTKMFCRKKKDDKGRHALSQGRTTTASLGGPGRKKNVKISFFLSFFFPSLLLALSPHNPCVLTKCPSTFFPFSSSFSSTDFSVIPSDQWKYTHFTKLPPV